MKKDNMLILNLDKLHTTKMGIDRIKKNLCLDTDDVVLWCKNIIKECDSYIFKQGKNWYVQTDYCILTINSYSYTIITAHKR